MVLWSLIEDRCHLLRTLTQLNHGLAFRGLNLNSSLIACVVWRYCLIFFISKRSFLFIVDISLLTVDRFLICVRCWSALGAWKIRLNTKALSLVGSRLRLVIPGIELDLYTGWNQILCVTDTWIKMIKRTAWVSWRSFCRGLIFWRNYLKALKLTFL